MEKPKWLTTKMIRQSMESAPKHLKNVILCHLACVAVISLWDITFLLIHHLSIDILSYINLNLRMMNQSFCLLWPDSLRVLFCLCYRSLHGAVFILFLYFIFFFIFFFCFFLSFLLVFVFLFLLSLPFYLFSYLSIPARPPPTNIVISQLKYNF